MKIFAYCAVAALALGMMSCGGKDVKELKKMQDADKLTAEQTEQAIDYYLGYLQGEIDAYDERMDEANYAEGMANGIAINFSKWAAKDDKDKSDQYDKNVYNEHKDEITKLEQEKKAKEDEYKTWKENFEKENGLDK